MTKYQKAYCLWRGGVRFDWKEHGETFPEELYVLCLERVLGSVSVCIFKSQQICS